jgi:hypothetical protein
MLTTQYCGGMEVSNSKVRTMLFVVHNMCSALLFWGEVYGQDIHSCIPGARKNCLEK